MKFGFLLFVLNAWAGERENSLMEGQTWAPLKKQGVIVAQGGYFPNHISLFVGERLRLFVTTTLEEESCLIMRDPPLFLALRRGRLISKEITFILPGAYPFYCPSEKSFNGKIAGTITVLERPQKSKRTLVGAPDKKIWVPREN